MVTDIAVGEWMQERDISAVLGPWNEVLAAVAEEYNIPFVVVGKQTDIVYKHGAYWMNPHPNILWHIINDLALLFKWDTATVIYQDANGKVHVYYANSCCTANFLKNLKKKKKTYIKSLKNKENVLVET